MMATGSVQKRHGITIRMTRSTHRPEFSPLPYLSVLLNYCLFNRILKLFLSMS